MIEPYLVSKLDTISSLGGQCYPVAAPVGDVNPPFCLYTRVSGDILRDLSEDPVYYQDVFRLDLYGDDVDALFALEQAVIDSLTQNNVEVGDMYIFSAEAAPGSQDGFDLSMEMHRRSVFYTVTYWR